MIRLTSDGDPRGGHVAVEHFANAARRRLESNLHCTPTAARSANLEANRSGSLSSRHSTVNLPAAGAAAAPRRRAPATLTAYVSMDEDLRKIEFKEIPYRERVGIRTVKALTVQAYTSEYTLVASAEYLH